jgi:hypothetical protein
MLIKSRQKAEGRRKGNGNFCPPMKAKGVEGKDKPALPSTFFFFLPSVF